MRIFAAIIFSLCIFSALADERDTSVIVIRGEKNKTDSSSYDSVTLDEKTKQLYTLADILEDRVGIQVRRYGSTGSYSTVSIRGSNPNQVAVFLDGVPLGDSAFGEVNLELIPIDSIEKIEIYRGSAPIRFGTNNVGGVINLITKKNKGETESKIAVSYGSFNTREISAYHSHSYENSSLFISAHAGASDGNFPFTYDNGTKTNKADDRRETRINNQNKNGGLTTRWNWSSDGKEIIVRNDFFVKDQGLPDTTNTVTHPSLSTVRNISDARMRIASPFGLPLDLESGCFVNIRKTIFSDPYNEIGFVTTKSTGNYICAGGMLLASVNAETIFQKITASFTPQKEYFTSDTKSVAQGDSNSTQTRILLQWGAEDEFSFFSKRLNFTLRYSGLARQDRFNDDGIFSSTRGIIHNNDSSHDYAAGMIAYIWKNLFFIRGNISTRHRTPLFSELFGDRGYIVGNPALKSEKSLNKDIGFGLSALSIGSIIDSLSFEYSYFTSTISDGIILIQNTQKTLKSLNIKGAYIDGHEFTFAMSLLEHCELSGNLTLQHAKDRSEIPYYNGNYLPGRPIYESNLSSKVYNRWGSITYTFNATGANYRDRANSDPQYLEKRIYHNLLIQVFPATGLTLSFEIKNVTANQTWDIDGYPLPGRSFLGSISYIF